MNVDGKLVKSAAEVESAFGKEEYRTYLRELYSNIPSL